jgi:glycosyltransferase involved in cell wall biosynthesis
MRSTRINDRYVKKRILILSYLFPPIGGSGAMRPLKIAKYLPSFGWEPIILTVKNPDRYYAWDPDLLKDLPQNASVIRTPMIRASWAYRVLNPLRIKKIDSIIRRYLIHPDEQIGWVPFARRAAFKITQKQRIKAVYSTSGPISNHIIAGHIKKKFSIPWIAEFRDEWFEAPNLALPTSWHKKFHFELEKKIVTNADRIVTMAPTFTELLKKHDVDDEKFATVTAGFDPDDLSSGISQSRSSIFTTVFAGVFYDSFRPNRFIATVNELIEESMVSREDVRLVFVGPIKSEDRKDIAGIDKYCVCEFVGFVPHKVAMQYVRDADVLLLLLSEKRGAGVLPSKVFEYMASAKPILALVPPKGEVAKIIIQTGTGVVVDFEDLAAAKRAYCNFYLLWKKECRVASQILWDEVHRYDQKNLVRQFASILCEATHDN